MEVRTGVAQTGVLALREWGGEDVLLRGIWMGSPSRKRVATYASQNHGVMHA